MRRLASFLVLLLAAAACGQSKPNAFVPPDGHWWLAASKPQQDGFLTGFDDCSSFEFANPGPDGLSFDQLGHEIGEFYRQYAAATSTPVSSVVARLYANWRRTGAYKFSPPDPRNEYSGLWLHYDSLNPIVRGFMSCQVAEKQAAAEFTVEEIVQRVADWYGIQPEPGDDLSHGNPKTLNDKLSQVILRAEREARRR